MRFFTAKEVHLELGVALVTLYERIRQGYYPPLETGGNRKGGKGYFENTFNVVKSIQTPGRGRPKNKC